MPAPELEWKAYEISAGAGAAAPHTLEAAGPPAATVSVEIPDLSAFPTPPDKARILLETAAEVEHALLVEYLYAAFSLKSVDEVTDSDERSALGEWFGVLHRTAREEMGHLMTAQNLLLAIGLPPNLEREDFPPRKDLYPFKLRLEPLTQRSLAKYVVAEAPQNALGVEDIVALATQATGTGIHHVGVIYGMLGVVFSTPAEIAAGEPEDASWNAALRELMDAAHQQAPAASWHLDDAAIDASSLAFQGTPDDWPGGGVRIHQIADRAAASEAIRDVAEQGEGLTGADADSHFGRFRAMYRGSRGVVPFPPAGGDWVPARAVPTDSQPGEITQPRTRRWAQLADLRYALLLGFIEHYLRTSVEDDRANLAGWAIGEMFTLGQLAPMLAQLPLTGGVAALPFSLPASLHLPATDDERWELQRARAAAAMTHAQEMQADPADADDPTLAGLLETDTERLKLMHGDPAPVPTTSFAHDVLPLFRPVDIAHMNDQVGMDLTDIDVVRSSAASISQRLKGLGGRRMPPPPDPPLTDAQIALFDRWVAEGFPP
jgi:ferritin-like protein